MNFESACACLVASRPIFHTAAPLRFHNGAIAVDKMWITVNASE